MKKKSAIFAGIALLLTLCMFIPSVQTFAISALSVFRVNNTKTIDITLTDIEQMQEFASSIPEENIQRLAERYKEAFEDADSRAAKHPSPEVRDLESIYEFNDFSVDLPKDYNDKQPILKASESWAESFTINTDKMNDALSQLGISYAFDSAYNGQQIKVNFPPAVFAQYDDIVMAATQGIYIEAPDEVLVGFWSEILNLPFLPENIKSQLSMIDLSARDVYIPVIMGVGRETKVGSTTGYIYTMTDLMNNIPELGKQMTAEEKAEVPEASVLLWTKDGVLYCLAGEKNDSELTQIARSVR